MEIRVKDVTGPFWRYIIDGFPHPFWEYIIGIGILLDTFSSLWVVISLWWVFFSIFWLLLSLLAPVHYLPMSNFIVIVKTT